MKTSDDTCIVRVELRWSETKTWTILICYSFFLPLDGNEILHSHGTLEYIPKIEIEIFVKVIVFMATINPKTTGVFWCSTSLEVENFSTRTFVTFPKIKCRTSPK